MGESNADMFSFLKNNFQTLQVQCKSIFLVTRLSAFPVNADNEEAAFKTTALPNDCEFSGITGYHPTASVSPGLIVLKTSHTVLGP